MCKLMGELGSTEKALDAWGILLHNYTRCFLTMERDQLVAISAMAKEFATLLGNEVSRGAVGGTSSSRAPRAFSQTKFLPGTVLVVGINYFPDKCPKEFYMVEVVERQVKLATSDLMGQVSEGNIVVKCQPRSLRGLGIQRNGDNIILTVRHHEREIGYIMFYTEQSKWTKDQLFMPIR